MGFWYLPRVQPRTFRPAILPFVVLAGFAARSHFQPMDPIKDLLRPAHLALGVLVPRACPAIAARHAIGAAVLARRLPARPLHPPGRCH